MGGERKASRRDLFRLLGRAAAEAAGKRIAPVAGGGRPPSPLPAPPAPRLAVPLEEGHLVLDLALHPVPAQRAIRLENPAWPGPVLLVHVTPEHFAAMDADCPHCERPLAWDPERDAAVCPRGEAAFRMDGLPSEGPREVQLRVFPCFVAGPRVEIGLLGE